MVKLLTRQVPTRARFTNFYIRFYSIFMQPVVCSMQWQDHILWDVGMQTPPDSPGTWAVTHESSKDVANPPVAQGSSPGPSNRSSWRHLLFPIWSCLVWVCGWPVGLGLVYSHYLVYLVFDFIARIIFTISQTPTIPRITLLGCI